MAELAAPADFTSLDLSNPYPGLRSFEPYEDYLYFGREDHTMELLTRLQGTHFLSVVGTSGSGKSSLVRAGLVPSLHGGLMTSVGSRWRTVLMRPGVSPIENLANAIEEATRSSDDQQDLDRGPFLEATLRSSSLGLVDAVRHVRSQPNENMLVVVDQFEEIFRFRELSTGSRDEGAAFVKLLLEGANSADRLYIVLTMRSDFIGRCMEFHDLPQAINEGQYLLPRLTRDELRLAITGPAGVRGARISPRLISRLLNDIIDDQDQLPVLQHALMRMWGYWNAHRTPEEEIIDLEHYRAIGTMSRALSEHAEKIYQNDLRTERQKEIAERLFKALTETDREGRGIRRPTRIKEVAAVANAEVEEVIEVVEPFRFPGRSFLMPPPAQPGVPGVVLDADTTIDLSHESLMRKWTTLIRWTDEESKSAELYRRLSEAADLHEAGKAALWRTPELDIALKWRKQSNPTEAWARRYNPAFSRAMRFLDRSRFWRTVRRLTLSVTAVVVLLALAATAARRNNEARLQAILSAQDPLRKVLLLEELDNSRLVRWLRLPAKEIDLKTLQSIVAAHVPITLLRDPESPGGMVGGAFAPIGHQTAWTVSANGTVRSWRADGFGDPEGFSLDEESLRPDGQPGSERGSVAGVAFSADREQLAVYFEDGSGWYGKTSGKERFQRIPADHKVKITALAFSPDASKLAIGDDSYKVRIWDFESELSTLGKVEDWHSGEISSVAFDTTGELLVSASWDGTARVWYTGWPQPPVVLCYRNVGSPCLDTRGTQAGLRSASFSPNGEWVVGAFSNSLGQIWRADGMAPPSDLEGHTAALTDAVFGPLGDFVVTSSEDGTVRIWATTAFDRSGKNRKIVPRESMVFHTFHKGVLHDVSLSRDGQRLLTVAKAPLSQDEPARIWSTRKREPRVVGRHASRVTSVMFSPDGKRLITASEDQTVRMWPTEASQDQGTREPIFEYQHGDWVRRAVFDARGDRVASASEDCTARVHRFTSPGEPLAVIKLYPDCDPTPRPRDVRPNPRESRFLTVAFENQPADRSVSASRLVTAGFDREERTIDDDVRWVYKAQIWDLEDDLDQPAVVLGTADGGHSDRIWRAEFSPDNERIVTASADETARLWNSRTGEQLRILSGHTGRVVSAAFSHDSKQIVTASSDRTAQIWSSTGEVQQVLNHGASVTDAAFSSDAERVVTSTQDGTARIWSASEGTLQLELNLGGEMWAAAFSPDGNFVATGSRDGSVVLWRVSPEELSAFAQSVSTACLDPEWRVRFLAESERTARKRFEQCERRYERTR